MTGYESKETGVQANVAGTEVTSLKDAASGNLHPESQYLHSWRLGIVILSLFLGQLLMALDVNIINVALPIISTHFQALQDVSWYGSAYLLTITAFQPAFGTFYKFFNIDITYVICILIFELGSVLCGAATSSNMFIVGRAIAGFGAAGILQGNLAVISQVVELRKRPLYMGVVISVFVITVCIGPVLGGVFTQHASWRWCFYINLPVGAVVLALLGVFLRVPGVRNANRLLPLKKKLNHLDPLGTILFLAAVTCLLLALQWGGQTKPWNSAIVIGLLVGFGGLVIAFAVVQWKIGERATIPLRVLRRRNIWTSALVLFFVGAMSQLICFYIPFFFQTVQGTSPIEAGVRFIPLMLPQMIAIVITGGIVTKWGYYVPYIILGEVLCIIGLALLTTLSPSISTVKWAAYLVITGLGMGTAMQLPYTAIQITLTEEDISVGNAIGVFSWQIGGSISIAMGQTIVLSTLVDLVPKVLPGVSGREAIAAGAIHLSAIAKTAEDVALLRGVWSTAIVRTVYFCIGLTAASLPITLCMRWMDARKVAEEREGAQDRKKSEVI